MVLRGTIDANKEPLFFNRIQTQKYANIHTLKNWPCFKIKDIHIASGCPIFQIKSINTFIFFHHCSISSSFTFLSPDRLV